MKRWIPTLAAAGLAVGLLASAGTAASAATTKHANTTARPGVRAVATKHVGTIRAVRGITAGRLANYSVVSAGFTAPTGAQTGGTVTCPAGTVVLGGGVFIEGSDLSDNVNTSSPLGLTSTTGWQGYVNNSSGSSTTFTVYAECATAPVGYAIVNSGPVDNPAGVQTDDILATCPAGTKVLGGGGVLTSDDPNVAINSSLPVKSSHPTTFHWRIDANNASSADDTAYAVAICGKKISGYKLVHPSHPVTNPAGSETFAEKACPLLTAGQTVPTGGGVYSSSGSTLTNINSTYPDPGITGWGVYQNNNSGVASTITPYAVCAL